MFEELSMIEKTIVGFGGILLFILNTPRALNDLDTLLERRRRKREDKRNATSE